MSSIQRAPKLPKLFRDESLAYTPRFHAYQRTDAYLFSQLIPYIGSKRRLLGLIDQAVERTGVKAGVFADLFAGSGVVSRFAKSRGFRVVSNDWEPYAFTLNSATISLNSPVCSKDVFDHLNALPPVEGYIARHFCPRNDESANPDVERMYYTRSNGMKIDAIRIEIDKWRLEGSISQDQLNYLVAPLISAASFTSNTSGVFKAYHSGWGGKTGTALYRIKSKLTIKPVQLIDNQLRNLTFSMDADELARKWNELVDEAPSIVYLDPPYNQHPYGSNYHMLNSIALWDCPEVPQIAEAKSAIRTDWRTERRSSFNYTAQALPALETLIDHIGSRWILLSYSTDGNIDIKDLVSSVAQRGAVDVVANSYKRYRVSSQRMSKRSHNVEFVLILDKHGQKGSGKLAVLEQINSATSV
jgi:adenine-specific DNA-methyltransferase